MAHLDQYLVICIKKWFSQFKALSQKTTLMPHFVIRHNGKFSPCHSNPTCAVFSNGQKGKRNKKKEVFMPHGNSPEA